jgi:hypothetical protein
MWRFVRSLLVLLVGSALVAGAYWALLNVPESNIPALLLSATLAMLIVLGVGATLVVATAAAGDEPLLRSVPGTIGALPLFLLGVGIFAALWVTTTWFDAWWIAHRGEADALVLRYTGSTRTGFLHLAIEWISWAIRWVVGLSAVVALAVAGAVHHRGAAGVGFRLALRAVPLLTAAAAVLLVSQGLWRIAPWRPENLPPTSAEVYFAAVKLGVLYVVTSVVAGGVLAVYRREAERI